MEIFLLALGICLWLSVYLVIVHARRKKVAAPLFCFVFISGVILWSIVGLMLFLAHLVRLPALCCRRR